MILFDQQDLYSSGPASLQPDSWQRQTVRRGFAGQDGELLLDLGRRSRAIVQTGRLQADTIDALDSQIQAIEAAADGDVCTLTGPHGREFPNTILEGFSLQTPVRTGRGLWCDYRIEYRQLR